MGKDIRSGRELFDGASVNRYTGRFGGIFEIVPDDGVRISEGDKVTFLVTTTVGGASFKTDKLDGSRTRKNTFAVEELIVLDPDNAAFIYDNLGHAVEGVNTGLVVTRSVDDTDNSTTESEGILPLIDDRNSDSNERDGDSDGRQVYNLIGV